MFDTTKEDLKDILRKAHEGRLQLPDFQRDYVWGDEDVRSLIASIAKGFPVGALLTLESGGEVRFKPRLLAGVPQVEVMDMRMPMLIHMATRHMKAGVAACSSWWATLFTISSMAC